ncbi:MAG: hypothetical protein HUU28_01430 [Planctomycetaceae bacterium]|nr:hypothetical protein [Planctomycetaceae bacterium]
MEVDPERAVRSRWNERDVFAPEVREAERVGIGAQVLLEKTKAQATEARALHRTERGRELLDRVRELALKFLAVAGAACRSAAGESEAPAQDACGLRSRPGQILPSLELREQAVRDRVVPEIEQEREGKIHLPHPVARVEGDVVGDHLRSASEARPENAHAAAVSTPPEPGERVVHFEDAEGALQIERRGFLEVAEHRHHLLESFVSPVLTHIQRGRRQAEAAEARMSEVARDIGADSSRQPPEVDDAIDQIFALVHFEILRGDPVEALGAQARETHDPSLVLGLPPEPTEAPHAASPLLATVARRQRRQLGVFLRAPVALPPLRLPIELRGRHATRW